MAQIAIANRLATDLNIDKIIYKVKYKLIGFGVGYFSGTLYNCIQSGKKLSFNCFVSSLATNWVNNLENFWLNYTPFGIIINHTKF
jgi:CRISPR/Cas system CSM-associated protein Csm5 (group 7 of RAMP superfamily)